MTLEQTQRSWLRDFGRQVASRLARDGRITEVRPVSLPTHTDGWYCRVGSFAGIDGECQIWLDHWLTEDGRRVYFTVEIPSLPRRENLKRMFGARVIRPRDTKWYSAGTHRLRSDLEKGHFDRPVAEMLSVRYLSFYPSTRPRFSTTPQATLISQAARFFESVAAAIDRVTHSQRTSALEGIAREGTVLARSRNATLRAHALSHAAGICEACEVDFSKKFGGRGPRLLQVHHRRQMAVEKVPRVTSLRDLAVLCANCHMLVHVDPKRALTIRQVKKLIAL